MAEESDKNARHPVDEYLERAEAIQSQIRPDRDNALDLLTSLGQHVLAQAGLVASELPDASLPLSVALELSDPLLVYLFAHDRADVSIEQTPDYLRPFAEKARKHVERGSEFCLDHALGISEPRFWNAPQKLPGEHKHRRLFLIAFHDFYVSREAKTRIDALRNAALLVGQTAYLEKSREGEFRRWRNENCEWLTWIFDLT